MAITATAPAEIHQHIAQGFTGKITFRNTTSAVGHVSPCNYGAVEPSEFSDFSLTRTSGAYVGRFPVASVLAVEVRERTVTCGRCDTKFNASPGEWATCPGCDLDLDLR